MKKIILIIMIMAISLFVGCGRYGDLDIKQRRNKIYISVTENDWDKLKNTVEVTRKNYPEYELVYYMTYYMTNKIVFIYEKKGK